MMKGRAFLVCAMAVTLLLGAMRPLALSERVTRVEGQRPLGAIRGRVDVRRAVSTTERRPLPAELGFPAGRDVAGMRRAVVYLETAPAAALDARDPVRGRLDQRNETFLPHVLAVDVGTVVDFPNNDSTYHNVFSLSKAKRFDLGRYARGKSKAVRFERPGVVRVFCDIHSHMSAFVLVFSHPFYATTDDEGRYRIDSIPPGTYTVAAWYEGSARDTRTISIPAQGGPVDLDFVIP
jgi:plastocyanin